MSDSLSLFNLIMSVCLVIGGVIAYRYGFSRTANEVQERVINALQSEVQTLHERIATLEEANTQHTHTITTICAALKQRGLHIMIEGDTVYIHDSSNNSYIYNTLATTAGPGSPQDKIPGIGETRSPFQTPLTRIRRRHTKKQ